MYSAWLVCHGGSARVTFVFVSLMPLFALPFRIRVNQNWFDLLYIFLPAFSVCWLVFAICFLLHILFTWFAAAVLPVQLYF